MSQTTEIKTGQVARPETEGFGFSGPVRLPSRGTPDRRNRALLLILGALALVGLAIGGIWWSRQGLVTAQTGKVLRQNITSIVTASGEIKPPPNMFATVNANSFGKVTEILVQEGQHVKKGQLLLRTEDIQQEADVRAQEAALSSARADTQVSEAAVRSASANLLTAKASLAQAQARYQQAKDDFNRAQQMMKEELIARQVFDQDLSNFQVAQAGVDSAKAQVIQAQAQLAQANYNQRRSKARVLQAAAQLVGTKDARNKTIYTSPFDGVITSLPVHVGENVVPGIQNQPGSVLFQVSDLSVITADVAVDETDIISVELNQPATVTIDAIPGKSFKGRVTQIGMSAINPTTGAMSSSQTSAGTGEAKDFQVAVTLDNPPPGLRPGLSATAKIITATRHDAVTIPIQALTVRSRQELEAANKNAPGSDAGTAAQQARQKEELQGVFVVRDGRATFVPVKTGIMGTTHVEVLSGLHPGEQIITGSYQVLRTLKNGARIKVDNQASLLGPPSS